MPISVPLHVPVHLLVPVPVHVLVLVPVTVHVHVLVPVTRERKRERESERVRNFIREIGDPYMYTYTLKQTSQTISSRIYPLHRVRERERERESERESESERERESERVRNFIREIGDPLSGEREIRVFVQRLNHKISDFFSFYGRHGNYFFSVGTCHNNRNMFRVRHFGITSTD